MRVIIRDSCRNMNICSNRKNTPKKNQEHERKKKLSRSFRAGKTDNTWRSHQTNGNFKRVSINGANKNIEKILEDKEGRIFFRKADTIR